MIFFNEDTLRNASGSLPGRSSAASRDRADRTAGPATTNKTLLVNTGDGEDNWSGDRLTAILMDGSPIEWFIEEIKGGEYAMFATPVAGAHIAASYVALQSADFNADGRVDELDLVRWQENFGVDPLADASGDEITESADYLVWQRQFNAQTLRPTTSVPSAPRCYFSR